MRQVGESGTIQCMESDVSGAMRTSEYWTEVFTENNTVFPTFGFHHFRRAVEYQSEWTIRCQMGARWWIKKLTGSLLGIGAVQDNSATCGVISELLAAIL